MNHQIPFNKPCLEGDEIANILESIQAGKIAGDGKFNQRCHLEIAKTLGAKAVLLTTSGTDALELAALLCDIQPGDEVILPSYTFVSTANAFCLRGARPVFIDIRPDTLNLDETQLSASITDNTKAIVPVHYAGVACEMPVINAIAQAHQIRVVEDAAHGFLASYKGQYLGTLGDLGCYSFHETKTFICGEGGAIAINREADIEIAEIYREKGTNRSAFFKGEVDKYTWVDLGSSFLPSDLIGAFLYGQFQARDQIIGKRQKIYQEYLRLLQPLADRGLVKLPQIPEDVKINYHMFYLIVQDLKIRTDLIAYLRHQGIIAVFHYVPLHLSQYAQALGIEIRLPITEAIANTIIRLPFLIP
ncbi:dTDP-4-amino-4,6-dideoxygalactose transaminase [Neosynechococcus sphagnicola]|uniref:dTDP-4-amino-4,6-dideoxygalactose transaminase n=1 Tax=Neosynechococcus sphagnicola TaxID=1501145 RepID=UPI000AA8A9D0|nr:dTDP-4-amino-4,6-dideoxygalactose transaminase [Neosynechococcus sphagnicola]